MAAKKRRILLFTDDQRLVQDVQAALGTRQRILEVQTSENLAALLQRSAALLLLDARLPQALLAATSTLLESYHTLPLVVLGSAATWHQVSAGHLLEAVVNAVTPPEALQRRVEELLDKGDFLQGHTLVGQTAAMQQLRERILQVAPTPVTVLITGESGAGKEGVAHALHRYSERRDQPFKPINCAAIPDNLLEDALFGHEKGAFTDARSQSRGLFEQADGGTVFLDEIGEMPHMAQVSLLRVLETREITRIGSEQTIAVDVRLVAATNRDLQEAVAQGQFRLDLYHRLKIVELPIPPLRRHSEDIPLLLQHFLEQLLEQGTGQARFSTFSAAAMSLLQEYDWPGNIRELSNLVERLFYTGPGGEVQPTDILPLLEAAPRPSYLPVPTNKTPEQSERELILFALLDLKREVAELRRLVEERVAGGGGGPAPPHEAPIFRVEENAFEPSALEEMEVEAQTISGLRPLKEQEKEAIEQALRQAVGNRKSAAELLGLSVRTLYRKLDEYGLK